MLKTVLYWLQWNWRRWSYGETLVGEFVMTFVQSLFQIAFVIQLFEDQRRHLYSHTMECDMEVSQVARTRARTPTQF